MSRSKMHRSVMIPDADYQLAQRLFGESWAANVRRIITLGLAAVERDEYAGWPAHATPRTPDAPDDERLATHQSDVMTSVLNRPLKRLIYDLAWQVGLDSPDLNTPGITALVNAHNRTNAIQRAIAVAAIDQGRDVATWTMNRNQTSRASWAATQNMREGVL